MAYSDGLRQLAAVVEALEDSGASIVSARPERGEAASSGDADAFRVHLCVDLPLDDPLSGVDPIDGTVRGSDRATDSTGGTDADEEAMGTAPTNGTPSGTTSGAGGVDDGADGRETATDGTPPGGDSSTPGTGVETTAETDADATRGVAVGGATGPEGGVDCRHAECDRVFDSEHGMKIHFTKIHGTDDPDGTAPYRDPDRLRAAYEATGSFAAMRDELGVDVSPETVRRYAVQYGIHERGTATVDGSEPTPPAPDATDATSLLPAVRPTSDPEGTTHDDGTDDGDDGETDAGESAGDPDDDGSPAVDVALPGDLTLADLKATVRTSDTLYQASRALDLDRDRTADLLGDLNLLDLVHGRVATKGERDELKADIDARLREGRVGPSVSS